MKQALVIGGGSENGRPILDCLLMNNFQIFNFGSSVYQQTGITNIEVDWNSVTIETVQKKLGKLQGYLDFIFFNQNSSSLNANDYCVNHDDILDKWKRIKDWNQSHWLSCQMPWLILHTVRKNLYDRCKIGWMLSKFIEHSSIGNTDFPDYSTYKYFNYLSMKLFGSMNQFKTFGIYPNFSQSNAREKLMSIIDDIVNDRNLSDSYIF